MSKRFLMLFAILAAMLLPASASAHVLVKDEAGGTGAIFHVSPDDDLTANKQVTLFFDIQDSTITSASSQAQLTITDDQEVTAVAPSKITESNVSAEYVFPREGLYQIQLTIKRGGTTTHIFSQSEYVSGGTAAARKAPAWAEIGIMATMIGAGLTAIIAFDRRKTISKYSRS